MSVKSRGAILTIVLAVVLHGCDDAGKRGDGGTRRDAPTGDAAGHGDVGRRDGPTQRDGKKIDVKKSDGKKGDTTPGSCTPDPLHTGLTAQQTGVSVDAFDCEVLKWAAKYNEPDAMIFKAIIYVECRFDKLSVACPNLPCGTPTGWTAAESGCYGLMQVVPACGGTPNNIGLLPNGHPNLTKDTSSSDWASSIFNPDVNIQIGIAGIAGNRAQVVKQFPGCTVDQYTMMAIGNYNSYGSTKSCTQYNTAYTSVVLAAYKQYSTAAGYAAHSY